MSTAPLPAPPPASASGDAYRLPRSVAPHDDESLPGLVARNAELWRIHDPLGLFRRLRPPRTNLLGLCRIDPGSDLGERIGCLLGLDDTRFRRLSMWSGVRGAVSVLGHAVWRPLVRRRGRTACPLCLREAPHHRAAWLLRTFPVCVEHAVWLHDRCPAPRCGRPLAWTGRGMHRCGSKDCRHDLREAPVERADPATLGGMAALHRLLHAEDAAPSLPPGMPFAEALKMSVLLGQIALGRQRPGAPDNLLTVGRRRLPEVIDAGWAALDRWPQGFHEFLGRLREGAAGRPGSDGLHKAFGPSLPSRVHGWARKPWGACVGRAFAEYVAVQPDMAIAPRKLDKYAPGIDLLHGFVSLGEAQRMLGISPFAMMGIAARRGMFVLPPRGKGIPARLRSADVRQLRDEMRDFVLPEEARAILGVGHPVMEQVEAAGLIRRVPEAERVMEFRPYRRSELSAFVAACVGDAPEMPSEAARRSRLTVLQRAVGPGRPVADICRALADGRLKSAATVAGATGLMRLRLRMAEVEAALPGVRETMSFVEAATELGAWHGNMHVWVDRGLFDTVRSPRPGEVGIRFTAEALARFRRDYVWGAEMARLLGQEGNAQLTRHLKFLGVDPVSGPGVDGSRLSVFRRSDCTPETAAAIRRLQAGPTGTADESYRAALERVTAAGAAVQERWGIELRRARNLFHDAGTGKAVHVTPGRRPNPGGAFLFRIAAPSFARLKSYRDPWVALVPSAGANFLLVTPDRVAWRDEGGERLCAPVHFDHLGRPRELVEWEVPMPGAARGRG